jgi:predicted amidohydrolase YtcJ
MPTQLKWFISFIIAGVVIVVFLNRYMPERVDTIYVNCHIYTMDANSTIAEAMAIANDRIVGIGTSEYIERKFKAKKIIDLGGKTILPGLIDAHCHLYGFGLSRMTVDLIGTHSEKEAAEKIVQRAVISKPEQWIRGSGWDQNEWQTKSFPTKTLLDRNAPNNPVYLVRIDGHACWVNNRALEIAGVNKQTPD